MKLIKTVLKSAADLADFRTWHLKKFRFAPFSRDLVSLANVAEGFRPGGLKTYYPVECYASATTAYPVRYLLVGQAISSDTSASTINSTYGISYDDMCIKVPTTRLLIPLGFMTDAPGLGGLDTNPISGTVQLLGGAQQKTILGVADGVINAGTILIASGNTAGYVQALPATAGAYYTVGLSISTSEANALPIEIDPRPAWIAVQVVT